MNSGLARSAFNLLPGVGLRDIEGQAECAHQLPNSSPAWEIVSYSFGVDDRGQDYEYELQKCSLCGEERRT
jgi:hypothetical protein